MSALATDEARAERRARARAAQIFGWQARRVGSTITITGQDADGLPVRLTRIRSIGTDPEGESTTAVFAVGDDESGRLQSWTLMLGKRPS